MKKAGRKRRGGIRRGRGEARQGRGKGEGEVRAEEGKIKEKTLTGEHNGSGISAKCVLQQPSKRRISIRDEPPARTTSGRTSLRKG